jgi:hypothetical protein
VCSSIDSELALKLREYFPDTDKHPWTRVGRDYSARSFLDSYLKNEIGFHLHFRATPKVTNLAGSDFALTFESSYSPKSEIIQRHVGRQNNLYSTSRRNSTNYMQSSVPVDSRPITDDSKDFPDRPHSHIVAYYHTVIRLYRLDKRFELVREWRDALGRLFELAGSAADGKLQCLLIGGKVPASEENGSIVDARIQRGPKLVEHLSILERELNAPIPINWLDKDFTCPVVLKIYPGSVGATCINTFPKFCQRLSMKSCPVGALPARLEW